MTHFIESNDPRISDPDVSLNSLQARLPFDTESHIIIEEEGIYISVHVPGYCSRQLVSWETLGQLRDGHNKLLKFTLGSVYNIARKQAQNSGR